MKDERLVGDIETGCFVLFPISQSSIDKDNGNGSET